MSGLWPLATSVSNSGMTWKASLASYTKLASSTLSFIKKPLTIPANLSATLCVCVCVCVCVRVCVREREREKRIVVSLSNRDNIIMCVGKYACVCICACVCKCVYVCAHAQCLGSTLCTKQCENRETNYCYKPPAHKTHTYVKSLRLYLSAVTGEIVSPKVSCVDIRFISLGSVPKAYEQNVGAVAVLFTRRRAIVEVGNFELVDFVAQGVSQLGQERLPNAIAVVAEHKNPGSFGCPVETGGPHEVAKGVIPVLKITQGPHDCVQCIVVFQQLSEVRNAHIQILTA